VFAVPGNITSAKSFGPNYLIKDGAKLVQRWRDVVEELPGEMKASILSAERGEQTTKQPAVHIVELTEPERRVLKMLTTDDPVHIDHLIAKAGLGSGELMGALLKLEMRDRVRQLPGKCFVKRI
jgi:DNA processing protein